VYENAEFGPRAWVARSAGSGQAEVREWSPNRIVVAADGPGQLVLGEVMYGGWVARVDGVLTPIETVDDLFRAVPLTDGPHQIVFEFRPRSVAFGAALTLLGLAALALMWRWPKGHL
jgi:uncharacterized membrane protein YfhO